jgi:plastocyanin
MHFEELKTALEKWLPVILLSVALAALSSCGSESSSPTGPGTEKELNSGDFGPGRTFQHRFAAAGTFPYHCIHHSPMRGSVVVSEAAADSLVNVSIVSDHVAFPAASVKPGGRVVWTNNTGSVHTVTSN